MSWTQRRLFPRARVLLLLIPPQTPRPGCSKKLDVACFNCQESNNEKAIISQRLSCIERGSKGGLGAVKQKNLIPGAASTRLETQTQQTDPFPPACGQAGLFEMFEDTRTRASMTIEEWNRLNGPPRKFGYEHRGPLSDPRNVDDGTLAPYTATPANFRSTTTATEDPSAFSNTSWAFAPSTVPKDQDLTESPTCGVMSAPYIPIKRPELPQKPLEYQFGMPAFRKMATFPTSASEQDDPSHPAKPLDSYRGFPSRQQLRRRTVLADSTSGRLNCVENTPAVTRANELRRIQSMRMPLRPANGPFDLVSTWSSTKADPEIIIRIAAVAATYVNSVPQNRGLRIDGDEIRRMLETNNPSVTSLCRMLRDLGVTLSEGSLVQALTRGVPNVNLCHLARPVQKLEFLPLWPDDEDAARTHTIIRPGYRPTRPFSSVEPPVGRDAHSPKWAANRAVEADSRTSYRDPPILSGTHKWVEQRMSRLMNDDFLKR